MTAAETPNRQRVETVQRQSHQPVEETLKETKELGVCAHRWKEEEILWEKKSPNRQSGRQCEDQSEETAETSHKDSRREGWVARQFVGSRDEP